MTFETALGMLAGIVCAIAGSYLTTAYIKLRLKQSTFNNEFLKTIRESSYKGDLMGLYYGLVTLGYDAQAKKLGEIIDFLLSEDEKRIEKAKKISFPPFK